MRNYHSRQQGGTLVGIIIGLVIGLGIALAVAVSITKTPMPFTNKMGKYEKQAAPSASQTADPNRPLYGNRAATKEAAKTFVKEPETRLPAQADAAQTANAKAEDKPGNAAAHALAAVGLTTTDKPKKPDVNISDAKKADGKEAGKDAAKDGAAKADTAEDKWSYYLQAGAFRDQVDAENTRAKLALMGVEARIMERPSENGVLYRVRIGPFAQLDAVNRVRGKLSDNGVDAAVVRITK